MDLLIKSAVPQIISRLALNRTCTVLGHCKNVRKYKTSPPIDSKVAPKIEIPEERIKLSIREALIDHKPVIFKPHAKATGLLELRPLTELPKVRQDSGPTHLLYPDYDKESSAIKLLNTEV